MALATLTVDFQARLGNLETAVKRTAAVTQKQAGEMSKAYEGVTSAVRNVGAALGVAFVAGNLTERLRSAINDMDALNDASDATGISIERLSGLQDYIAGFGGSIEDVTGLVLNMQRALSKAGDEESTGAGRALAAIGLEADKLRSQKPDEALLAIARALDKFEDGGAKTRVIQTLFKDAQAAAPVLKDLAAAGQLNATVTAEQAAAAEQFNKQLAALAREARTAEREIASALLPTIQQYARELRVIKESNLTFRDLLKLGLDFDSPAENIRELSDEIKNLSERKASFERAGAPRFLVDGVQQSIDGATRRLAAYKKLQAEVALEENAASYGNEGRSGSGAGLAEAARLGLRFDPEPPKIPKSTSDAMQRAAQEMVANWSPLALRWELEDASDEAAQKGADQVAQILADMDLQRAGLTEQQQEALQSLNATLADQTAYYKDLADPAGKYTKQLEEIARLGRTIDEQGNPLLSPEEVEKATAAINEQVKSLDKSQSFAEEFGLTMSSAFEDAIVRGGSFREILDGISQDIARIIVRKSVTEPLGQAVTDFTGKINWSSLFKFADGGIMTSGGPVPLRKYSGGGIASSPQAAIFAEGGVPEAFVPVPSGKIPVEIRGATGGVTVVQHINIDSRTDASSIRVMMAQARDEAVLAVRTELTRGGSMARLVGKS